MTAQTVAPHRGRPSQDERELRTQTGAVLRVIENHASEACYELVRQRDDHDTFWTADTAREHAHNELDAALSRNDLALARQWSAEMRRLDREADSGIVNASTRGGSAHFHARAVNSTVEVTLTGQQRNRQPRRTAIGSQMPLIGEEE